MTSTTPPTYTHLHVTVELPYEMDGHHEISSWAFWYTGDLDPKDAILAACAAYRAAIDQRNATQGDAAYIAPPETFGEYFEHFGGTGDTDPAALELAQAALAAHGLTEDSTPAATHFVTLGWDDTPD